MKIKVLRVHDSAKLSESFWVFQMMSSSFVYSSRLVQHHKSSHLPLFSSFHTHTLTHTAALETFHKCSFAFLKLCNFPSVTNSFYLCPSCSLFCHLSLCRRLLGNIKNTEPLDSKHQRVHTFWVTAFDCGKNRAQADAQVVVTVKPSCKPGWMGRYPCLGFSLANAVEAAGRMA